MSSEICYVVCLFVDLELLAEVKLAMEMCRPRMQGEVQRQLWTEVVLTSGNPYNWPLPNTLFFFPFAFAFQDW